MTQFPFALTNEPRFAGQLPDECDVVIIGGGIIGVMTAYYLAEMGVAVVLCEKGRVAGEQSGRNWGWIRQQGRDFSELPIMMESLSLWQALAAECGPDLGFEQHGTLYLARGHDEMFGFETWMAEARGAHGLDVRLQSRGQVHDRIANAAALWMGGLYTASDARAEPWTAVPVLAAAAERLGAVIVEDCAVRRLDLAGGRICGVVTEYGRVACEQVVVAGGAWSALFLRAHGVALPQLSVLASVAKTKPMPEVFAGNAADDKFAFRRRVDGSYTIACGQAHDFWIGPDAFRNLRPYLPTLRHDFRSTRFRLRAPEFYPDAWGTPRQWSGDDVSPFERQRLLHPAPNMRLLAQAQDEFAKALPALGRPEIDLAWAGLIDTLPDQVPVIDRVEAVPGLIVATGMSGHGFGIGPGVGKVVANLVEDQPTGHDLTRFRFGRFAGGARIVPARGL